MQLLHYSTVVHNLLKVSRLSTLTPLCTVRWSSYTTYFDNDICSIFPCGDTYSEKHIDIASNFQWTFQDPKMQVLCHIRLYFGGISPYIANFWRFHSAGCSSSQSVAKESLAARWDWGAAGCPSPGPSRLHCFDGFEIIELANSSNSMSNQYFAVGRKLII